MSCIGMSLALVIISNVILRSAHMPIFVNHDCGGGLRSSQSVPFVKPAVLGCGGLRGVVPGDMYASCIVHCVLNVHLLHAYKPISSEYECGLFSGGLDQFRKSRLVGPFKHIT